MIQHGADINAKDNRGNTPLNGAINEGQKEIANLLLDEGGEFNTENYSACSLLYIAASAGMNRIVDIMLKKEIDFLYKNEKSNTLLHGAALGGLLEFAELLLIKGLKVEEKNVYGQTPLHLAVKDGHKDLIDLFLRNGADLNIKTKNGRAPIHFAEQNGHKDIVDYLKEKGANSDLYEFPELSGNYLGEKRPGSIPGIFAPGIVSTGESFEHSSAVFSHDNKEVYWSARVDKVYKILYMKIKDGKWSSSQVVSFCEQYSGGTPFFSPDGEKLYFASSRPLEKNGALKDSDIWVVKRRGDGWSEPINLGSNVNSEKNESNGNVSEDGTLYFRSNTDLFKSRQKNGNFQPREDLGSQINTDAYELAPYIAPDGSYLIFESNRPGGMGGFDLYICYKKRDDSWSDPINLGDKINTEEWERFPALSPDGNYLFFLRVSDGSDIYWVDAKIIEELKPDELK